MGKQIGLIPNEPITSLRLLEWVNSMLIIIALEVNINNTDFLSIYLNA